VLDGLPSRADQWPAQRVSGNGHRVRAALVTVSYAADYERCALLVETARRHANVPHYLVVSRADRALFSSLLGGRTRLVLIEELWPWRLVELRRFRLWLSLYAPPMRGWILQQVVKLAAADYVGEDVLVFCDSEVAFVRPFDTSHVVDDAGRVRLFHCPGFGKTGRHLQWQRAAARLLGLAPRFFGADYVGNIITWRRDTLLQLRARIDEQHGDWRRAVCRRLDLSEYTLYGIFVESLLAGAGHYLDEHHLCHALWTVDGDPTASLRNHLSTLGPSQVAVQIQSRLGIPVEIYREALLRAA
jgi:hypothetical protein